MDNVNKIVESNLCYGCGTCNVICAHNAISMQFDAIGRLAPVIDSSKCNDCGLCYNNCPSLDLKEIVLPDSNDKYLGQIKDIFIGKATDQKIFKNAQSGGLVTAVIKYLFDSGKIDAAIMCRVEDAKEYTAKAVVITSAEDLYSCQKSSYVPIDIVSAMREAVCYDSIAVVGTGCHIQGIRALQQFNKYKEKIKFTLGLICDRTLCKTVTQVLYGFHAPTQKKRLVWRDKTQDYKTARLLIKTKDKLISEIPSWQRHVLKDPFTNPRCRICFDKLNTGADVVFGDPWGMEGVDWQNGMSLVLTRSSKGAEIIQNLIDEEKAELEPAPLDQVIKGQSIEQRKEIVSAALKHYKNSNWLLPTYSDALFPIASNPNICRLIDQFVEDSNKKRWQIVLKNRILLWRIQLHNFLNRHKV